MVSDRSLRSVPASSSTIITPELYLWCLMLPAHVIKMASSTEISNICLFNLSFFIWYFSVNRLRNSSFKKTKYILDLHSFGAFFTVPLVYLPFFLPLSLFVSAGKESIGRSQATYVCSISRDVRKIIWLTLTVSKTLVLQEKIDRSLLAIKSLPGL